MGIYAVKPWFRGRLARATGALVRRGVTPDQVTAAGLAAAALGGVAVWAGGAVAPVWLLVPVCAFGRIAANALDGLVAQASGTARPAGELFNETADRLGDAAFLGAAAALPGVPAALAFAALAAAALASFVGIAARAAGGTRRYDGPMGKPDRMAVVSLAAVAALLDERAWVVALWVVVVGGVLTAANRYRAAWGELEAARERDAARGERAARDESDAARGEPDAAQGERAARDEPDPAQGERAARDEPDAAREG